MQISSNQIYPQVRKNQRKHLSSNPYQAQMPKPSKEKMTISGIAQNTKRNINSIAPALETKLLAQDVNKLLSQINAKTPIYLNKANNEIKELNQYVQNKSRRKVEKLAQNAMIEAQDVQAKTSSMIEEINELINQGYIFKYKNFSNPYKSIRFNWQNDKVQSMDEYDSNNHLIRTTTLKEVELRNGKKIYTPETIEEYSNNSLNRYTFKNDEQASILETYQEGVEMFSGIEKCKKQMSFNDGGLIDYAQDLKAYSGQSENIKTYLYFDNNELKGYKEDFERLQDGSYRYGEAMFYDNSKLKEFYQDYRKKEDKTTIKIRASFDEKNINKYEQGVIQYSDSAQRVSSAYMFKNDELSSVVEGYSENRAGTKKYKQSLKFNSSKPSCYTEDFEKRPDGTKTISQKIEFDEGKIYKYEQNCTYLSNGQEAIEDILTYETNGKIIQYVQQYFKTIFGQLCACKVYDFDAFGKLINI